MAIEPHHIDEDELNALEDLDEGIELDKISLPEKPQRTVAPSVPTPPGTELSSKPEADPSFAKTSKVMPFVIGAVMVLVGAVLVFFLISTLLSSPLDMSDLGSFLISQFS